MDTCQIVFDYTNVKTVWREKVLQFRPSESDLTEIEFGLLSGEEEQAMKEQIQYLNTEPLLKWKFGVTEKEWNDEV